MPNTGYPTEVPWYTPPRTGDTYYSDSSSLVDEDYLIADRIEGAVSEYRIRAPIQAQALEIYMGAYKGASPTAGERYEECNVKPGLCRRGAYRAKQWIEARI